MVDAEPVVTITSYVYRTAYARNGNVANATQYKRWNVYRDGALYASSLRTLREAKALAAEAKTVKS